MCINVASCSNRLTLLFSAVAAMLLMQFAASAQTLVNRYSFSDTDNGSGNTNAAVADSAGGTNWNGTLPAGGTFTGTQLTLNAGATQYVQLPAGILSNYTAVTIDSWVTFPSLPVNCFFFGFGNTDAGGLGENYIFCAPQGGRIAITGADPGYTGEQGTGGAGDLSGQTVHLTAVFNSPAGYDAIYTNGVLVSENNTVTTPLSAASSLLNYIGRSLYTPDPNLAANGNVDLNEFRIWNGALNSLQVAGCDIAGPDTVGSATNAGAITNIQLNVPFFQLVQGTHEASSILGQATLFPSPIDITTLSTYTSGNTNVLSVNTNGVITAVNQGSSTIIAHYGSVSSTQAVTVVPPASVLVHRYSFSDADNGSGNVGASLSDSIGGTNWNGTLPSGGTLLGTQVQLLAPEYVQLPSGILSNYSAVTIDAWATFLDTLPGNCFFFGFGNTDPGGAGENYIYLQPSSGHIGITGTDPGYIAEQQTGGYGNLSSHTNIHLTAVFNPPAGYIAIYTNGTLVSANKAVTTQFSSVSSVLNYIGRSLYNADAYMDIDVDEFRIFNGSLTSQGVAIAEIAGPDSIPSGVTNGVGSVLSLSFQAPTALQSLQTGALKLLVNYANLTNFDLVGNSVFAPAGLTIFSSDTNVLVFGTDNKLHGVNPGTARITAIYQGTTNSQLITVTHTVPQLTHRYSFSEIDNGVGNTNASVADSVGGLFWNGTLPNGGTFANGQLLLNSTNRQYVQLPTGIITNNPAITIEAWVSSASIPTFAFFYGFGNTDAGGLGENYLFGSLPRNYAAITGADPGYTAEQGIFGGPTLAGRTNLHWVAIYNPPAGYIAIFTNGVLEAETTSVTTPLSAITDVLNYIGRSLYNGDPYPSMSVDEFRIYSGAMDPAEIGLTQALGPNLPLEPVLSAAGSVGQITLLWSTNYLVPAFTLYSRSSLTSGAAWNAVGVSPTTVGTNFQVTLPATGSALYFRLSR
jgi:Concanavalin A-like lectin/glucanases superfamily